MEDESQTDSLDSLFPPVDKPRFANLDWPIWDGSVFDPNVQALDDGSEMAFIAGTLYVRYAVSTRRPENLTGLLDGATRRFLARWGIEGFIIGKRNAIELVRDDLDLLSNYRSGVLFAIKKLRECDIPEEVNKDDLFELLDALEAYAHEHYVAMSQLGPGVAAAQRLDNFLGRLGEDRTTEESHNDDDGEGEGYSEEEFDNEDVLEDKSKESSKNSEQDNMNSEVQESSARQRKRAKSNKAKKAKRQAKARRQKEEGSKIQD